MTEKIEINYLNSVSLKKLLEILKEKKVKTKDFGKLEFVLNYDNCYYEGDLPDIRLVGNIDKNE